MTPFDWYLVSMDRNPAAASPMANTADGRAMYQRLRRTRIAPQKSIRTPIRLTVRRQLRGVVTLKSAGSCLIVTGCDETGPWRNPLNAWFRSRRLLWTTAAIVLVVVAGSGYVAATVAGQGKDTAVTADSTAAGPSSAGDLMFVDLSTGRSAVQRVAIADPGGARGTTAMTCQRVYTAKGTTVCLRLAGPGPAYAAEVSRDGAVVKTV